MKEQKILILVVWFGDLPPYFELFLETVKRNHSIDFLFITDASIGPHDAPNIRVNRTSLESFSRKASKKLRVDFAPDRSYKLCDLRPMLGVVCREEIADYDFFGWCDIDVLFSDLRTSYTSDLLSRFDVFSAQSEILAGHLTLLRNTFRYRNQFRLYLKWKAILETQEYINFDEVGLAGVLSTPLVERLAGKCSIRLAPRFADFLRRRKRRRLYIREQYVTPLCSKLWIDGSVGIGHPSTWFYKDGTITNERDGDRSFLYLHFMALEKGARPASPLGKGWQKNGDYYLAQPKDMTTGIVIDTVGIRPI